MLASEVSSAIDRSLDGLRLLSHPFYRSWQDGLLADRDLALYAEQYRHFERSLPDVLSAIAGDLPAGEARRLVQQNLDDESSQPEPHVRLFEGFADAVGARPGTDAAPATRDLVGVYAEAAKLGPVPALAVIAAYEVQAGDIATTKAGSLKERYGLTSEATRFWDVHSEMEDAHADWTVEALNILRADPDVVSEWSGRSAKVWWSFLDDQLDCSTVAS
jgi:pyrroloquinoline quinone (PQQ) biosynthesis protein C